MADGALGPRRSAESHLRESRMVALVALIALGAGIVSDAVSRHVWERKGLVASLGASLVVVMLSVVAVNKALERRRRHLLRPLLKLIRECGTHDRTR